MTKYDPCPVCGDEIRVEEWKGETYPRECLGCGARVTGWNEKTGEITDTITARQAAESQAE